YYVARANAPLMACCQNVGVDILSDELFFIRGKTAVSRGWQTPCRGSKLRPHPWSAPFPRSDRVAPKRLDRRSNSRLLASADRGTFCRGHPALEQVKQRYLCLTMARAAFAASCTPRPRRRPPWS